MSVVDGAVALGLLALVVAILTFQQVRSLGRRLERQPPLPTVEEPGSGALQHVGLVRFQAFHDTGGDHSFALALLDSNGSGVVVTSLYHRERCRVYAKPVEQWQSSLQVTDEETEAIKRAREDDRAVDMAPGGV